MKACAYVRISTEEQSQNSIPGQIADIEHYCKKNDLTLVRTFIENGQSAFNFNRKEWKELEQFVKEIKDIKYLVIASMDRFSRANIADSLKKMEEIQERTGVKILTVTDPVNLDTTDFGVELRRVMELIFANYELKKIRKRTADGMYQLMISGRFPSMAPYGYINSRDSENKPLLRINDEKAFVVRLIFRSYIQGMNIEEIRRHVNVYGFKLSGNSAIQGILSNPIYAAMIRVPARGDKPAHLVKAIHPPIVSETDYWLVQERLNSRKIVVQRNEEVYLRGVIRCSDCGRLLTAGKSSGRSKKYWYYFCKTHKKNLPANKVHEWFEKILDNLSLPEESLIKFKEGLKEKVDKHISTKTADLMKTNLSLQRIVDRISSVEEKYLTTPDISEKTYKKIITDLRADESRLRGQVASLSVNNEYLYSMIEQATPKLLDLKKTFFRFSIQKQHLLINTIFNNYLSFDGKVGRTAFLSPLFKHNELVLKEKGLLLVEQSVKIFGITPISAPYGSLFEPILAILSA